MTAREGRPVRYRARVEYDGTDFAGFQVQPGRRTVQGELEAALARLDPTGSGTVDAAGRTDAGVHASGQVIAFTYRGRTAASGAWSGARCAPPGGRLDRRPCRGSPTGSTHAMRRGTGSIATPSGTGRAVRFASVMRSGCGSRSTSPRWHEPRSVLVGRHDFSAFGTTNRTSVRTVHAVRVARRGRVVTIDVAADAFLRGMVRRIVAVLIEVGHGRMDATAVAAALGAGRPALDGASAPPHGLCLRRVVLGRTGAS